MAAKIEKVVESLAKMYGFDKEEAMMSLKPKKQMEKPSTLIPFIRCVEGWCDGIKQNHNLFTQCPNKPTKESTLCRNCQKEAEKYCGRPKCGLASEREAEGELWRDPKGRVPIHYGNVFMKKSLDEDVVKSEMKRIYGIEEVNEEMLMKKTTRGRPKKITTEVETSDDEEKPVKKGRGRPRKSTKMVTEMEGGDLIDTLVAQAKADEPKEEAKNYPRVVVDFDDFDDLVEEPKEVKKTKKTKLSDEEKAAAKAAKEAAKQKKAEEKAAAKAAKQKKTNPKKTEELQTEEPEEVQVIAFEWNEKKYLRDSDNIVYDHESQEPVGKWNETEETVEMCEFEYE
jgi:chemotaxis protein histidine kinase CheA